MTVNERIELLRKLMAERGIDVYYVPNEDDHLSAEYTADFFKCKSFLSGFSGESGCVIVTKDFAGLWTDGRYFTQAEKELAGSDVTLMRMGQKGVLTPMNFLVENTPEGGVLGFDGRVVSSSNAKMLARKLKAKKASLHVSEDLVDLVWEDRPSMPLETVYPLGLEFVGESVQDKVKRVRAKMKEEGADVFVLTSLEDPCWLLNVRGHDIECTPVSYAFCMVTMDDVCYYVEKEKVSEECAAYFEREGVTVKGYTEIDEDLASFKDLTIWADLNGLNAYLYSRIDASNTLVELRSPIELFRAVKNDVELENTKNAHIKDGVAVTKFIYWLKKNVGKMELDEIKAQDHLYGLREMQDLYLEPSFPTISAYKGNAAMMHYSASEKSNAKIHEEGFLLVDSGGQYKDGTTDITRTISLGNLSQQDKTWYTLVLKGHLDLNAASFLYGTTGCNVDILARRPLWNLNVDYQCGTGHGVGHVLGVHEGPHGIRWGNPRSGKAVPFEPGMIVTNEPGVYLPDELGIRIENELLVVKDEENFYGQWLRFEQLTYAPYDRDAIDVSMLEDCEIAVLNAYQKAVYDKISPFLNEEEKAWLKEETKEVSK